jgi:hypothetical protein
MTKQDFELIADTIKQLSTVTCTFHGASCHRYLAERFADRLRQTNPRFNRQRFLSACGIDSDLVEEPR